MTMLSFLISTRASNPQAHCISAPENPQIIHYLVKDKTSKNNAYQEGAISWKDAKTISPSDFVFTVPKNAQEVFIK